MRYWRTFELVWKWATCYWSDHFKLLIAPRFQINSFKYNQQRVATVKYLGELYNYRVIESKVIFDVLWSLITFGHRLFLSTPLFHSKRDWRIRINHSWRSTSSSLAFLDRFARWLLQGSASLHFARYMRKLLPARNVEEKVGRLSRFLSSTWAFSSSPAEWRTNRLMSFDRCIY